VVLCGSGTFGAGHGPEVVTPGHDAFVCATPAAWEASPRWLLPNPTLRATLGTATRRTIASSATPWCRTRLIFWRSSLNFSHFYASVFPSRARHLRYFAGF
jgi:hypothetical protein